MASRFEWWAAREATAGNPQQACMFTRAAHLSLASVNRWLNVGGAYPGSVQIVKNWYPPADRFGYETYSNFMGYNGWAAEHLAFAYALASDDASPECSAPADAGGFVFQLPDFYLTIANAGGTYVEIGTGAQRVWDETGLSRVHINTCATQPSGTCVALGSLLGPSAPPSGIVASATRSTVGGGAATGPFWTLASGTTSNYLGLGLTAAYLGSNYKRQRNSSDATALSR